MISALSDLEDIVCVDTEFTTRPGEHPQVICLVFHEFVSGRKGVVFADEMRTMQVPPFRVDARAAMVAHYAIAELVVMIGLGWPLPINVIDTHAEFRVQTNTDPSPRAGLLDACAHFGIETMSETTKAAMRDLALRGGHSPEELVELGRYCADDVEANRALFGALVDHGLDVPRALVRGQFAVAAARSEVLGVPVDAPLTRAIADRAEEVACTLVGELDTLKAFDGTSLRQRRLGELARERGLAWPTTDSGLLSTKRETLKAMATISPDLQSLVEISDLLDSLRLVTLPVGADGRARTGLSIHRTKTGRSAPKASESVLAQSAWRRGLITPPPGRTLAYIDYEQQEFAIAAILSGDEAMLADYMRGDAYLALAVRTGRAPIDATKESHGAVRDLFKLTILGVQYSMSEYGLAVRLGISREEAARLLALHKTSYAQFWRWNDAIVVGAQMRRSIRTVLGWTFRPSARTSSRTLRNFPMQATGAEILRIACILGWERGVQICAPLHDAVLIEAPTEQIEEAIAAMSRAMRDASKIVLGHELRVSHETIGPGERWLNKKTRPMWNRIVSIVTRTKAA